MGAHVAAGFVKFCWHMAPPRKAIKNHEMGSPIPTPGPWAAAAAIQLVMFFSSKIWSVDPPCMAGCDQNRLKMILVVQVRMIRDGLNGLF